MSENHHKVIIIGSGPAGFTAALYTARANLDPIIFEGLQPGGQLTITTDVENYPGFEDGIMGPELMDVMRKQVHKFGAKSLYKLVTEVDFSKQPFVVKAENEVYTADSVIISTVDTRAGTERPAKQKRVHRLNFRNFPISFVIFWIY